MQSRVVREYRAFRRRGVPAKYSLSYARRLATYPEVSWEEGYGGFYACLSWRGFDIRVKCLPDDDFDTSWIGRFSDTWEPRAIEVLKDPTYNPPRYPYYYFHPASEEGNLDWKLMKEIISGEWTPTVLTASASKAGVGLGSACVGGYLHDVTGPKNTDVWDIVEEACDEAVKTLKRLCTGKEE